MQIRNKEQSRLLRASARLEALSPIAVLSRGYALIYVADGTLLRSAADTAPGETIRARLANGFLEAEVKQTEIEPGQRNGDQQFMKKLFGTDGIRAVAGQSPLDAPTVYAIGLALAHTLAAKTSAPRSARHGYPRIQRLDRRHPHRRPHSPEELRSKVQA